MTEMPILVQRIEVAWTKASRGAPGATSRNAVPDAFRLPADLLDHSDTALYHDVVCDEWHEFQPATVTSTAASLKPQSPRASTRSALALQATDGVLVVDFHPSAYAIPRRHSKRAVLNLRCGEWGRVAYNARFGGGSSWQYRKYVYNILHRPDDAVPVDVFASTEPVAEFERFDRLR